MANYFEKSIVNILRAKALPKLDSAGSRHNPSTRLLWHPNKVIFQLHASFIQSNGQFWIYPKSN